MDAVDFLQEIMATLRCDAARAEGITFVVLQELRERLPAPDAARLAAQLPEPLRRLWLEDGHEGRPIGWRYAAQFLGRVRYRAVLPTDAEAELAVRAVFGGLQELLRSRSDREADGTAHLGTLTSELTAVWRGAATDAHAD